MLWTMTPTIGSGSAPAGACRSRDDASLARSAATEGDRSTASCTSSSTPGPEVPAARESESDAGFGSPACACAAKPTIASQVNVERGFAAMPSLHVGGSGHRRDRVEERNSAERAGVDPHPAQPEIAGGHFTTTRVQSEAMARCASETPMRPEHTLSCRKSSTSSLRRKPGAASGHRLAMSLLPPISSGIR